MATVLVLIILGLSCFQLLMYFGEKKTAIGDESIKISRADIGLFGSTEYRSVKPWEKQDEEIYIFRLLGTSKVIMVGEGSRVTEIHHISIFITRKNKVIYFNGDETVTVIHGLEDREGVSRPLGEFEKELRWAEEKVQQTRRRYASLIPSRFKEALGIS